MKAGDVTAREGALLIPVPEVARLLDIGQMLWSGLGEPFELTGTVTPNSPQRWPDAAQ